MYIVPILHVQITIPEYQTSFDYETSGDVSSGESKDDIFANVTIGDSLTLECTVTAVRGISSSVDIIWTTGGRVVRRVDNITADIENDSTIYTDSFEISSLSAIDNGREYQCTVVINASQPVNSSDQFTLKFFGEFLTMHNIQHSYVSNNSNKKYSCSTMYVYKFSIHTSLSLYTYVCRY